jgi:hypothetical protein
MSSEDCKLIFTKLRNSLKNTSKEPNLRQRNKKLLIRRTAKARRPNFLVN